MQRGCVKSTRKIVAGNFKAHIYIYTYMGVSQQQFDISISKIQKFGSRHGPRMRNGGAFGIPFIPAFQRVRLGFFILIIVVMIKK